MMKSPQAVVRCSKMASYEICRTVVALSACRSSRFSLQQPLHNVTKVLNNLDAETVKIRNPVQCKHSVYEAAVYESPQEERAKESGKGIILEGYMSSLSYLFFVVIYLISCYLF